MVRLPQLQVGGLLGQGGVCVGRGATSEMEGTAVRGAINDSGIGSAKVEDDFDVNISVHNCVHIRLSWIPYLGILMLVKMLVIKTTH